MNRTGEVELDEANRRRLLGEAAAMLESIRKVDLTPSSTLVAKEQRSGSDHISFKPLVLVPVTSQ